MSVHYLAMMGKLEELKQLLSEHPELLNAQDTQISSTPLMLASLGLYIEVVEFLLSKGADIYATERKGANVLHILVIYVSGISDSKRLATYYIVIEMLLQRDAELHADNPTLTPLLEVKDKDGHTPLWILKLNPRSAAIECRIKELARAAEARVRLTRALAEQEQQRQEQQEEARHQVPECFVEDHWSSLKLRRRGGRRTGYFGGFLSSLGMGYHRKVSEEQEPLLGGSEGGKLKMD